MAHASSGNTLLIAAAIICSVHFVAGGGFLKKSEVVNLENINGFPLATAQINGDCVGQASRNPFIIQQNQTSQNASIDCPTVYAKMKRSIIGFIPVKAIITLSRFCQSQNSFNYNASLFRKPATFSSAQQQQSLSAYDRVQDNNTNPLRINWGAIGSFFTNVGCGAAFVSTMGVSQAISSAVGGPCSPSSGGISADQFATYAHSQEKLWQNQADWNNRTTSWIGGATRQFDFLQSAVSYTRDYQIANSEAVGNLTKAFTAIQPQINILKNETAAAINTIQDEIRVSNANQYAFAQALQQATLSSQDAVNKTLALMAQYQTSTNEAQANITAQINTMLQDTTQKFLNTQTSLIQLASALQAEITRSPQQVPLTRMFHQQMAALQALNQGGQNYNFFLENSGLPGVTNLYDLPANLFAFNFESPQLKYIFRDSISNRSIAGFSQLKYTCGGLYAALNQHPVQSATQLINTLGPKGCNNSLDGQGPNFCNCWIEVFEQGCAMFSQGGQPTNQAISNFFNHDSPTLIPFGRNGSFCEEPIYDFPHILPNNNTILSASDLLLYNKVLCARGTLSQSDGYGVFSPFFAQKFQSGYVPCSSADTLLNIFAPPTGGPYNVMYSVVQFMILAYGYSSTAVSQEAAQILGTVPLNTTIVEVPFNRFDFGTTGPCTEMYVVAYDTSKFLTVYSWELEGYEQTVTLRVGTEPPRIFTNGVLSNPFSFLVDQLEGAYTIGDDQTDFRSTVYNIAYSSLVPDPNAIAREGGYLYPLYGGTRKPSSSSFNLTNWRAQNYVPFNHLAAFASAEFAKCTVTCDSLRCACTHCGSAANGNLCRFLDRFEVQVVNENLLYVSSIDYNVLNVDIAVPTGVFVGVAGSACPVVTPGISGNSVLTLNLYNSLAIENKIRVVQSGACPVDEVISLSALATFPYEVSYCPETLPGQSETITFYYNPGLGYYTSCNATYNVSLVPNDPTASFQAAPTYAHTETRLKVSTDQSLIMAQQVLNAATQMSLQLIIGISQVFQLNKVLMSNDTANPLGAFADVFQTIAQLSTNVTQALNNSNAYVFSYSDAFLNYTQIAQQAYANSVAAQQTAREATTNVSKELAAGAINFADLTNQLQGIQDQLQTNLDGLLWSQSVTASIIAEAQNNPQYGGFNGLGDFLLGIAKLPIDYAKAGAEGLGSLVGDVGDAASGVFGGAISAIMMPIIIIVIIVVVVGGLGYLIYYLIKSKPAANAADARMDELFAWAKSQGFQPKFTSMRRRAKKRAAETDSVTLSLIK